MQLDIIRETEVNITTAAVDQSDSLATEKRNHKHSSDLLAKTQKKLAAQPGERHCHNCCCPAVIGTRLAYMDSWICCEKDRCDGSAFYGASQI